jgi:hypothetical protein
MPRIKLSEQYHNEREEICKKLIDILKLDDNNSFLLYELDENIEKQASILAMKDDIQKCFPVSSISTFKPSMTDVKRDYLNIVRGILRQQGYIFAGSGIEIKIDDNICKRTTKYIIFRNK